MTRLAKLWRVLAWSLLGSLATVGVWADGEQAFKQGVAASDQQDWSEAAEHFRRAVADDGQESSRRVFISGAFSSPYLPHFYLGWTLYQWDAQYCSEALQSWEKSMEQGVVQSFRRQYQDLRNGREACLSRLLPPALAGAEAVLGQSRNRLRELAVGGVLDDAEVEDVETSIEALEHRLTEGRVSKDLEAVGEVTRQAEEVTQDLDQRRTDASAQSDRRLQNAAAAVRSALDEAERAERQVLALLADPTYAAVRRTLPQEGVAPGMEARLDAVQAEASRASRLGELQAVETEARDVAEAFQASLVRLRELFDAELRRRAAAPPERRPAPPSEAEPVLPQAVRGETPRDPSSDQRVLVRSDEEVARDRLRTRIDELLDWVQGASPTPMMSRQMQRLEGTLEAFDEGALTPSTRARFEASLAALQLLATGHAFLGGEPGEALRWVDLRPLPEPVLAAHGQLFAAAARFDLFRQGGEQEGDLLEAARLDVQQCRRWVPDLNPDVEVFSPAFRRFYVETLAQP